MNTESKSGLLTVTSPPHLKNTDTTSTIMVDVLIALVPAMLWGIYTYGLRAAVIILISTVSCVLFEGFYQFFMNIPVTVKDCSAAVTGVLLALTLPATVPVWIPVIGAFFAIIVVKQLYGGIGKNVVNPAIAARVFLFLAWPGRLAGCSAPFEKLPVFGDVSKYDVVSSATPLASLKTGALPTERLFDVILGRVGGAIGETSAILLLLGGIYLLLRRTIKWHIPVAYIATVAVLSFFIPHSSYTYMFVLYQIFSGGLMLGAFFMATDYVTSPVTWKGRLIYGVGCGVITVVIRCFGKYPEGVSFAIMIMNLLVWYLDKYTKPSKFGGVEKNESKK